MKLALVGAGSLGIIIGALLTKGGYDIELFDSNPANVDALNAHGAKLGGNLDETIPVTAKLPEEAQGPYDVVFLLTKQLHTKAALKPFVPLLSEQGVVCTLQNGTPEDQVIELVGRERTLSGNVMFAGEWTGPGETRMNSTHAVLREHAFDIGELDGSITERVREVASILSTVGGCTVSDNLIGSKWAKLAYNAALSGLSTAMGMSQAQLSSQDVVSRACIGILDETIRTAEAHGVRVEPLEGMSAEQLKADGSTSEAERLAFLKRLVAPYPDSFASMLQDLQKGLPCEKDYILGRVIEVAEIYGVQVPLTRVVYGIIADAESQGTVPDPARSHLLVEKVLLEQRPR